MFATNGSMSETSINTPATGHDSAWKKAAIVTIIATMLPRSSRGLDDIVSTTGYCREIDFACRKRNCNPESSRRGLGRSSPDCNVSRRTSPSPNNHEDPGRLRYEDPFNSRATFSQTFFFIVASGGSIFPEPVLHGPFSVAYNGKRIDRTIIFQEK